jgi:hypothetical protein
MARHDDPTVRLEYYRNVEPRLDVAPNGEPELRLRLSLAGLPMSIAGIRHPSCGGGSRCTCHPCRPCSLCPCRRVSITGPVGIVMVMVVVMVVTLMVVMVVMMTTGNLRELVISQIFQNDLLSIRRLLKNGEHGSLLSELRLYKVAIAI